MVLLEANVDDATGEALAHAVAALLDAGAHDAWVTPIVMKKGRPGPRGQRAGRPGAGRPRSRGADRPRPARSACAGTTARALAARRATFESVDVDGHPVARSRSTPARAKVEHDDAAEVARATGRPLREVVSLAEEAARRRHRAPHPADPDFSPDEPA